MGSLVLRGPPSLPRRSQVKTLWPEVRDSPSDLSLSGAWLSLLTQQHGCIQASCPEPLNCGQTDFFQSTRGCDRSLFTPPKVSLSIKNKVQARHQSLWGLDPAYFGAQLAGSLPCSCPGHLLLPPSTPGPSRLLIRSLRLCPPPAPHFPGTSRPSDLGSVASAQSTECHTVRSPAPHQAVLMASPCCIVCSG